MPNKHDYPKKFESFKRNTFFPNLAKDEQDFLSNLSNSFQLTYQEFRQVVEAARDLDMWGEEGLSDWWVRESARAPGFGRSQKKFLLQKLQSHLDAQRTQAKTYPKEKSFKPVSRQSKPIARVKSDKKIFGMCPVASEKTVCCNLRTIDAVEQCVFGCSYCTVQTFYGDRVVFDPEFSTKIKNIRLDPDRFYHIGTGQASDSLAFGNREGILDTLCDFARAHPKILLEFKTKSNNVRYLLENDIPGNCVCSWSLNTSTIIENEEHFTARLDQRILAARQVADKGLKVAFHFHPMVYYDSWHSEYMEVASNILDNFDPAEVLFISFGTITFIKPVIQKIRELGHKTKILQMEMVSDPLGKLTYPDDTKVALFKSMYEHFEPWRNRVFMYLCMEKAAIWKQVFGFAYETNEEFERDFGRKTMSKLPSREVIRSQPLPQEV